MHLKRALLNGVMGGALLLAPVALAQANDNTASERLEERVEKGLEKIESLRHLDVDVDSGVVTLKGEVASAAEKAKAERIARTAGAKTVVNQVEIDADKAVARVKDRAEAKKDRIDEQAARQKDAVDRQTEVTKDRVERTAEYPKTNMGARETSQKEVFDPLVTAKVKTRIIKDDLLDKSDINVDTDADGMVTLKGWVPTEAARTRALELARTTEGVRKVVDRLEIKAPIVK
jgi:hyperosmotically inducible periplasmic protein